MADQEEKSKCYEEEDNNPKETNSQEESSILSQAIAHCWTRTAHKENPKPVKELAGSVLSNTRRKRRERKSKVSATVQAFSVVITTENQVMQTVTVSIGLIIVVLVFL